MKIRNTARLILLGPGNHLLLMNIRSADVSDPSQPLKKPFWVTLGGKIEDGETLQGAAQREAFEETGFRDVVIGPAVWHGKVVLDWKGELTELNETFLVAHTSQTEISRNYLTTEEQKVVQKYKWWSVNELSNTSDIVIPVGIADLLPAIVAKQYPLAPLEIDLSTPDETFKKKVQQGKVLQNTGPS